MTDESAQRVRERIALPETLQAMLDNNTTHGIGHCYDLAVPTDESLVQEVSRLYDKAMKNLNSTFSTDDITRQERMLAVTDNQFYSKLPELRLELGAKTGYLTSFAKFVQQSTAISAETRAEWFARISKEKLRLRSRIDTLIDDAKRDYLAERTRRLEEAR